MFLKVALKQNIFLPSKCFKKNFRNTLVSSLLFAVEGKKIGSYGQIIFVTEISHKSKKARIIIGSSSALFSISYVGVSLRLFNGEIIDSVVSILTEYGFFSEIGNLQVFISKKFIPRSYNFDQEKGFFMMRDNPSKNIEKDIKVRLRIIFSPPENPFILDQR